jgi:hypothetical protein
MGDVQRYASPEGTQYMDEDELSTEGYLLEANRQFFHPLGLQLVLQITDDGFRLRVIDSRSLLAGPVYEADGNPFAPCGRSRREKVARIRSDWEMRAQFRLRRYGYVVQPTEEL